MAASVTTKRPPAQQFIGLPGASHVVMLSHAEEVARVIDEAAAAKP